MKQECSNIYRNARTAAGLTQERFSEMLGVSPEAVRQYEGGKILPSDEVVMRMAEVSGMPILGYWHLKEKSKVAAGLLPEVKRLPIGLAVLQLVRRVREYAKANTEDVLITIAEDGTVSPDEWPAFEAALEELDGIVQAALALRWAELDGKE